MKEFYLGIDLGTTNSVVAYGNFTRTGQLKCNVLDIERKTENGGQAREKTLPSVVFYYKDPKTGNILPEVGDYAKGRYGTKLGYVSKSVKSLMGVDSSAHLAEEIMDKSPAQVSSQILKYLVTHAKKRLLEEELSDVIITVPASFDSDQCQATIQAAELAGINVENEHDILLYEPKAVIYDFINMQETGEIPEGLLNLDQPKNILVFDLGGGTLDVTVHRVGYNENNMMNIEDLAISRYTKIGGDNFDEMIAEEMYKHFQNQVHVKIPEQRREEVMCKLRKSAERLKVNMSNDYETALSMGKELGREYAKESYDINLYDCYSYDDEFTIEEVRKIISPLMGGSLKLQDVKRIDSLKESDMNNIIYPILDVLAKAGAECKIDAVILNGGMTRFFPIRERIDEFFGLQSLVTSDPDLSVARGAVYYHYCLHKYGIKKTSMDVLQEQDDVADHVFHVGTILNDNLNIGLAGEYVSRLVDAGTKLPYVSPEVKGKYSFDKNSDTMSIEIFLGRGKTKNLPNRRIADRIIKFSKVYPANTEISFRLCIDNMRLMRMEAWITGKPDEKALISVDTNGQRVERCKIKAAKIHTNERQYLNAKGELNHLKVLALSYGKKPKTELIQRTNEILERIQRASNQEEFYEPMIQMLDTLGTRDLLRGYLYASATYLAEGWTEQQKKVILRYCKEHFSPNYYGIYQDNFVMKKAIEYISIWDEEEGNFLREIQETCKYSYFDSFIEECLQTRHEMEALKEIAGSKEFMKYSI